MSIDILSSFSPNFCTFGTASSKSTPLDNLLSSKNFIQPVEKTKFLKLAAVVVISVAVSASCLTFWPWITLPVLLGASILALGKIISSFLSTKNSVSSSIPSNSTLSKYKWETDTKLARNRDLAEYCKYARKQINKIPGKPLNYLTKSSYFHYLNKSNNINNQNNLNDLHKLNDLNDLNRLNKLNKLNELYKSHKLNKSHKSHKSHKLYALNKSLKPPKSLKLINLNKLKELNYLNDLNNIRKYSSTRFFSYFVEKIRSSSTSEKEKIKLLTPVLNSINILKKYKVSVPGLLFRGLRDHNIIKEGELCSDPAPLSCTLNYKFNGFAKNFITNSNPEIAGIILYIFGAEGVNINPLSSYHFEYEVLVKPASEFYVEFKGIAYNDEGEKIYKAVLGPKKDTPKEDTPKTKRRNSVLSFSGEYEKLHNQFFKKERYAGPSMITTTHEPLSIIDRLPPEKKESFLASLGPAAQTAVDISGIAHSTHAKDHHTDECVIDQCDKRYPGRNSVNSDLTNTPFISSVV